MWIIFVHKKNAIQWFKSNWSQMHITQNIIFIGHRIKLNKNYFHSHTNYECSK